MAKRKTPPAAPDPLAAILSQMGADAVERQQQKTVETEQRRLREVTQCAFGRVRVLLVEVDRAKMLTADDAAAIARELAPALAGVMPALAAVGRAEAVTVWPHWSVEGEFIRVGILNSPTVEMIEWALLLARPDVLVGSLDLLMDFVWEWTPGVTVRPYPSAEEVVSWFTPVVDNPSPDVPRIAVTDAVRPAPPTIIPNGLPPSQQAIMQVLAARTEPISAEALVLAAGYALATIQHAMPALINAGLVDRAPTGGYKLHGR